MKVGIRGHFDSMHRLPGHAKCDVPHGHTYKVDLTVEGPLKDGMVIDFEQLGGALRSVLKNLDHCNLNEILPYPSCENLAIHILEQVRKALNQGKMTVRVWEGDGKWAEAET